MEEMKGSESPQQERVKIPGEEVHVLLKSIRNGNCQVEDIKKSYAENLLTLDQHSFLMTELAEMLEADSLTGLNSSRLLKPKIGKLIELLNSQEGLNSRLNSVIVAVVDLNKFKPINDTYGHLAGNKALRFFAERLREVTKDGSDVLFRMGGDEFVIVIPIRTDRDVSDQDKEQIFKRLETSINTNFDFRPTDSDERIQVTASIGYATAPRGYKGTYEDLLKKADEHMYENKTKGETR